MTSQRDETKVAAVGSAAQLSLTGLFFSASYLWDRKYDESFSASLSLIILRSLPATVLFVSVIRFDPLG